MLTITVLVMYDNAHFKLNRHDVQGVDFMARTPDCLSDVKLTRYSDGVEKVEGKLGNLKVIVSPYRVAVYGGSLCKWHLGNNYKTMTRGDMERAMGRLSDTLHLPMDKATVYRLDVARNIPVNYPVDVYFNHLGEMQYAKRLAQPNGLYYVKANQTLAFYDKNREQREKRETIPELYQNKNVLRIELRYIHCLGNQFGVEAVTGAMLYDEKFYIKVVEGWRRAYKSVNKINDTRLNFEEMRTIKQLKDMGVLALVEKVGGELAMRSQISAAQKRGILTSKQAFDLRNAVKSACELGKGLTVKSEAVVELDEDVKQSINYYR